MYVVCGDIVAVLKMCLTYSLLFRPVFNSESGFQVPERE